MALAADMEFSRDEILRYSRHLLIPEVGLDGQKKLKASAALVVGAGVGRIGLVDYDVVDSSNLQRQVIHSTSTVGKLKVDSARERLGAAGRFGFVGILEGQGIESREQKSACGAMLY